MAKANVIDENSVMEPTSSNTCAKRCGRLIVFDDMIDIIMISIELIPIIVFCKICRLAINYYLGNFYYRKNEEDYY